MSQPEPSLVLLDSHGVYIPQIWCADIDSADCARLSLDPWAVAQCQAGPDSEHYWEAWDAILSDCATIDDRGTTWRLYQDGDLWEVPDGFEWPE